MLSGGIIFSYSSNNTVFGNSITKSEKGIVLRDLSLTNTVHGNNITNNTYGVYFGGLTTYPSNNTFHHNNFINNTNQAYVAWGENTWDDGYPSGGNYWSDHTPPDVYSGPYQNETGRDKIGDIPYIIDGNNTDRYPLIYPYGYVPTIDVNNDGLIDIVDIVIVALAFGSKPGDPNWNPYADINQDGIVDIQDIVMIAIHFGETW